MQERTRKYIIFSLLPISIIWALFNISGDNKKTEPKVTEPPKSMVTVADEVSEPNIDIDEYSKMAWGKDPFYRGDRPAAPSIPSPLNQKWRLAGILYSEFNPYAVINRKIVRPGDSINGASVLLIEKDAVTLEKNGSQFKLSISKEKT